MSDDDKLPPAQMPILNYRAPMDEPVSPSRYLGQFFVGLLIGGVMGILVAFITLANAFTGRQLNQVSGTIPVWVCLVGAVLLLAFVFIFIYRMNRAVAMGFLTGCCLLILLAGICAVAA